jgi:uncharacterized protein YecT (DUF1311 family)
MSRLSLTLRVGVVALVAISIDSAMARCQAAAVEHGAAANREYAAVFAHPDNPCSTDYATAPYMQCISKELTFIEPHLDAFIDALRGMAGSQEELAALNQTDTAWRDYRKAACALPYKRFPEGTIKGPLSAECQLSLDRAYMKQLSNMYILKQFPK